MNVELVGNKSKRKGKVMKRNLALTIIVAVLCISSFGCRSSRWFSSPGCAGGSCGGCSDGSCSVATGDSNYVQPQSVYSNPVDGAGGSGSRSYGGSGTR